MREMQPGLRIANDIVRIEPTWQAGRGGAAGDATLAAWLGGRRGRSPSAAQSRRAARTPCPAAGVASWGGCGSLQGCSQSPSVDVASRGHRALSDASSRGPPLKYSTTP